MSDAERGRSASGGGGGGGGDDFFDGKWWESGGASNGHKKANGHIVATEDINDNKQKLTPVTPSEKVRLVLDPADDDITLGTSLFCQLNALCHFHTGEVGWKQVARWLKYEEKVEHGNRWSKPHVGTASLNSLFEIRRGLVEGQTVVALDLDLNDASTGAMAESIAKEISEKKDLPQGIIHEIKECLMKPHKHKHRHGAISKKGGICSVFKKATEEDTPPPGYMPITYPNSLSPDDLKSCKPNKKLLSKMPKDTEAANILIGECDFLSEPLYVFARLSTPVHLAEITEVAVPTRFIFLALGPSSSAVPVNEELGRALGVLFSDKVFCQVAHKARNARDLADGLDEFIDGLTVLPPGIWDPATRLEPPLKTLDQSEVRKRLHRGPTSGGPEAFRIGDDTAGDPTLQRTGRLFGGMVADMRRRYRLYLSDLKDALHIQCVASTCFLYFACITPIVTFGGLMGDGTGNMMGTMESILSGAISGFVYALFSGQPLTILGATGPMLIFETLLYSFSMSRDIEFLAFRFWIGMWIALILLLFVAFDLSSLVQYITRFTEECFSVLISLIFIMEAFKKVAKIWKYQPAGVMWNADLSCYCRPPDEEAGTVINGTDQVIYGISNFTSMLKPDCLNFKGDLIVNHGCLHKKLCEQGGWHANGTGCDIPEYVNAVPDVFFFSVFIFLATFTIAFKVKHFRDAPYFPSFVRNNLSDFAVLIAILICIGIDALFGLDTPKLFVPGEFKTTLEGRGWLVNPTLLRPWYMILLALVPALLATILVFLDQQISAVIVNRKEHKLKKGHGYHLDLCVLAVLFAICSALGLPWFVAATVRSITHVKSLVKFSDCSAPGDRPEMLGVREQRLTGICIHILIAISIFITKILNYIPMSVLYGVFLYMGVTSLNGVQFVERIMLLFMPKKYQPDTIYLRHVHTPRVHIFTFIQIICMAAMWAVKSISMIAICFPVVILGICFVRKAMDYMFSLNELYWLDHLLPDATRRKKEDGDDKCPENEKVDYEMTEKPVLSDDERRPLQSPA